MKQAKNCAILSAIFIFLISTHNEFCPKSMSVHNALRFDFKFLLRYNSKIVSQCMSINFTIAHPFRHIFHLVRHKSATHKIIFYMYNILHLGIHFNIYVHSCQNNAKIQKRTVSFICKQKSVLSSAVF